MDKANSTNETSDIEFRPLQEHERFLRSHVSLNNLRTFNKADFTTLD
jgi:hypothetical protein